MKKHIASILFLFLLSTFQLIAQSHSVKRLGIEQGLSNNYVVSITQDKQGFLWFATEEGLNKFDGTRFTTYYKNDLTQDNQGITGNELNRVYADTKHPIIWIATQRDGLNAYNYNEQTFTAYQHNPENPHSLITNDVTDIAPSTQHDDGLWISTYYRGIEYLDITSGQFTHYNKSTVPSLPCDQTWTVLDGGDGNLYIGHVGSGFSIFSPKDKSVKNFRNEAGNPMSLPGNDVFCIIKDANGNIWLGTNNGLALYDAANENFITFKNNKNDKYATLCSRILSIRPSLIRESGSYLLYIFLSESWNYIIPPMPPIPGAPIGISGLSSFFSTITHSVVRNIPAIEAAFSRATRVTLAGSTTPAACRFS